MLDITISEMKAYNSSNSRRGFLHLQKGNGVDSTKARKKTKDDVDYVSEIDLGQSESTSDKSSSDEDDSEDTKMDVEFEDVA